VLHDISAGVAAVASLPQKPVELLNTGFATATNFIAQALPSFPAATLMTPAMGLPHAHITHPPSGPPPVPPTPIPPVGMITLGTCIQVLINGKPAARSGDLGLNPTCCGLPPFFELQTGSSKVLIGGSRAARALDITMHCTPVAKGAAARGLAKAGQIAMKVAAKAGQAAQLIGAAGDVVEAVEADNSAMSAALALNASMTTAALAADAAAIAAAAAMGKDQPIIPPTGTPGAVSGGSPNVLIGGFPMPGWGTIAKGLMKMVKGLKMRRKKSQNKGCGEEGEPIDVVTGANVDRFDDFVLSGPL